MALLEGTPVHQPSPAELEEIIELQQRGRFLQAWEIAQRFAEPKKWDRVDARLVGARLVSALGADRLGSVLHVVNHRAHPDDPRTFLYYAFELGRRSTRLQLIQRLDEFLKHPKLEDSQRSDLLSYQGWLYGQFRDFERSDQLLADALEAKPDNAWAMVQQAELLSDQDRYEESLEKSRAALEMRPWYRPAVDSVAERLYLLNRDEEAIEMLRESLDHNESWRLARRLHLFHSDRDEFDEAMALVDEIERRMPLAEKPHRKLLARLRTDYHLCRLGLLQEARQAGRRIRLGCR